MTKTLVCVFEELDGEICYEANVKSREMAS